MGKNGLLATSAEAETPQSLSLRVEKLLLFRMLLFNFLIVLSLNDSIFKNLIFIQYYAIEMRRKRSCLEETKALAESEAARSPLANRHTSVLVQRKAEFFAIKNKLRFLLKTN